MAFRKAVDSTSRSGMNNKRGKIMGKHSVTPCPNSTFKHTTQCVSNPLYPKLHAVQESEVFFSSSIYSIVSKHWYKSMVVKNCSIRYFAHFPFTILSLLFPSPLRIWSVFLSFLFFFPLHIIFFNLRYKQQQNFQNYFSFNNQTSFLSFNVVGV